MPLETEIHRALAALPIAASRLFLTTPGVAATVPMIRGVFGAALRAEDETAYQRVFVGGDTPWHRLPTYLLRPASAAIPDPPALEFLRFGDALAFEAAFERAWQRAAAMGLGKARQAFILRRVDALDATGAIGPATPWPADQIPWPFSPGAPCRLVFPAPLRLLRDKRLVITPTLPDVIGHALRRLAALAGSEGARLAALAPACLGAAEATHARPWRGRPLDLRRYSGAQKQEVELRGIAGALTLPHGPGPLWPLLAAVTWTHLGKGTVFGLGQMLIAPREERNV